jgi:hypothetical protein
MTPSSATAASNYIISVAASAAPSSSPSTTVTASPSVLQFPATPFGQVSAPQMVTVTNPTQSTVTVRASSLSDFVIDPSCGPLTPGQSCTLSVRYVPNSGVQHGTGQLTINAYDVTSTAFLGSTTVSVDGFGVPEASVGSPAYPPLVEPLGLSAMSITNTSAEPLLLSSIFEQFYAGHFIHAMDASACPLSIEPGGSCTVQLGSDCPFFAVCQVEITSNAMSSPDVYQVVGTPGALPMDDLEWYGINQIDGTNPSPSVFPMTAIGVSTSIELSVSLFSPYVPMQASISVTPNTGSEFAVDNQCPAVLIAQLVHPNGYIGNCYVYLTFTPKTPGFHTGTVTFSTSFGLFRILLAGTGAVSPLSVTPSKLLFPGPIGQPVVKTVSVTNTSTAAVSLPPAALTGVPYFSITQNTCGPNLAAGATCTIQITYSSPAYQSNPTPQFAQLVIYSGIYGLWQTVNLTGLVPQLVVASNPSSYPPLRSDARVIFCLPSLRCRAHPLLCRLLR